MNTSLKHQYSRMMLTAVFVASLFVVVWALADAAIEVEALPADFSCSTVSEIPKKECRALVALYISTDGDNWDISEGWLETNTPCSWRGVTCETGHVIKLKMMGVGYKGGPYSFGLNGSIPPEIGNLSMLETLNLQWNNITIIPPEISQLTNLTYLSVGGSLSSIPPEIGNLSALTELYLGGHQLSNLPPEIGNLSTLTTLNLPYNQLSNLLPEIGNLSALTKLYLSYNQLSSLPPEIGNLSALRQLVLGYNQLSSLPPEVGNLSALTFLVLVNNQLSNLPPEIGDLSALTNLYLDSNQLSSLPPEIGNLSALMIFHLSDNQLSSLPSEIGNLSILTWLFLGGNQLSSLPPEFGYLNALTTLYLDSNQLSSLPPEISNIANLHRLWLGNNQFTSFPQEITDLSQLLSLKIQNNPLKGVLPLDLTQLTALFQFWFYDTDICPPNDLVFQAWLTSSTFFDVRENSVTCVTGSIPPSGDAFTSDDSNILYSFPSGSFTETVTITHYSLVGNLMPVGDLVIARRFEATAVYSSTGQIAQPTGAFSMTIHYTPSPVLEDTQNLFFWDGTQWLLEPTAVLDTINKTIVATPETLSEWAVLGKTNQTHFPQVAYP